MKSRIVILIALLSFLYFNLNAQVFVGGNAGLNTSSHKNDNGKTSDYNLSLSPNAGKFLSEKFAIGFALDISISGSRSTINTETITRSSTIGVSPFLRYYAIKWDKFSLFGQGNIGLDISNSRNKVGGVTTEGPRTINLFTNIYPGLSWDLSDKLSLETSLNFLSLGYNYSATGEGTSADKISGFYIRTGLNNIVTLNNITVGAKYKF